MPVSTTTSAAPTSSQLTHDAGHLKLRGHQTAPTTTAYAQLDAVGYEVVKGVISPEKAKEYADRMYNYVESFGLGFKKDDRSTWHVENLPKFNKGGMIARYGAGHEQFAWDIRSEPELMKTFGKIWNTEELLVSFDIVNVSLPFPKEERSDLMTAPWPHVDQSPARRFKHCIQGIMNFEENGPDDGGLMVLDGTLPLYAEFFDNNKHDIPLHNGQLLDSYHYTEAQLQWFYDRGCKWKKVEAGPGDVILWDSRCIHYGAAAKGDRPRVATYVCYKPARDVEPDVLELRKKCIENWWTTSHDPLMFRVTGAQAMGKLTEDERTQPPVLPVLSDRAKQLAGVLPY
ncbi:hypothetical protein P7C73_g3991, partial [Tremellales sp. Uapishka_1]